MKLHFQHFNTNQPSKSPMIILHGLFGSSKNWTSIGKSLSTNRDVYALDLRNHGDSPHSSTHCLEDMVEDLSEFIKNGNLKDPIVLGHSMGGLVTMLYALKQKSENLPSLSKIIIQDIAPREYPFDYDNEVESMKMKVSNCSSRNEIDEKMKDLVPDKFIRQFLQMNLERKNEGGYYWKLNVDVISESRKMFGDVFGNFDPSPIPALFILGGISPYIMKGDRELIKKLFPNSSIQIIENGGHYMQYTHSEEFLRVIREWD